MAKASARSCSKLSCRPMRGNRIGARWYRQTPTARSKLLRSAARLALIRDDAAFFQDELKLPHIGDVLERIGADHNQVGKLAHLNRAQFGDDAANLRTMARRRH